MQVLPAQFLEWTYKNKVWIHAFIYDRIWENPAQQKMSFFFTFIFYVLSFTRFITCTVREGDLSPLWCGRGVMDFRDPDQICRDFSHHQGTMGHARQNSPCVLKTMNNSWQDKGWEIECYTDTNSFVPATRLTSFDIRVTQVKIPSETASSKQEKSLGNLSLPFTFDCFFTTLSANPSRTKNKLFVIIIYSFHMNFSQFVSHFSN